MDNFAQEVRELWKQGETADEKNREEALLDLEFAAGEQWDDEIREYREAGDRPFPLPCLTINQIPQFVGQVVGDRRANSTSIKVLPREDGDKDVAEVRSELIRSIEHQSKADRVYTQAFEQAVTCGIGNFRVDLDYAYEDAFERDLFIRSIPNPLAVNWDPMAADPTGRDAGWCFVNDRMTHKAYEKEYPEAAKPTLFDSEAMDWCDHDTVRVAEYWRIEVRERTIAMMLDGSIVDVTGKQPADLAGRIYLDPGGKPRMRKAKCRYAVMTLTNGMEQLTDPFELKIPRIPIIRVMGREVWVGDRRVRFGLTRFARDPQRLKNYWRSVVAELLMGAPRANYIAFQASIKGREADWPNTLVANDNTPLPTAVTTQNLAALVNEAQMCAQDMKDVTGLHDASLGMKGNETSGVAIQRRQNEGDIATIGYHDNMNAAMQEAGEVLNALIPVTYDTPRTIRVIGEDDAVRLLRVNDPAFEPSGLVKENIDIGKGRYDVAIATGPAYATKRQEAAAGMIEFARSSPSIAERAGDLIAKAQDWPMADEFAERLQPDGAGDPEDMTEEQRMAAAQAQQMAQAARALEMREAEAKVRKAEADAEKAEAEADKAKTDAARAKAEMAVEGAEMAGAATGEFVPMPEEREGEPT